MQVPADAEKYPNWLPVGESGFNFYFRIYLPCDEILNNTWTMPGIEKEEASDTVIYTVSDGDTLWSISEQYYGTGTMWGKLYEANADILQNPKLIYTGQVLILP